MTDWHTWGQKHDRPHCGCADHQSRTKTFHISSINELTCVNKAWMNFTAQQAEMYGSRWASSSSDELMLTFTLNWKPSSSHHQELTLLFMLSRRRGWVIKWAQRLVLYNSVELLLTIIVAFFLGVKFVVDSRPFTFCSYYVFIVRYKRNKRQMFIYNRGSYNKL